MAKTQKQKLPVQPQFTRSAEMLDFPTFKNKLGKYNIDAHKLDVVYRVHDCRSWSALINPGKENIFVTYIVNRDEFNSRSFDIITDDRLTSGIEEDDIYQRLDLIINKETVTLDLTTEDFYKTNV